MKRYDFDPGFYEESSMCKIVDDCVYEDPNGEWVSYEDYRKLCDIMVKLLKEASYKADDFDLSYRIACCISEYSDRTSGCEK